MIGDDLENLENLSVQYIYCIPIHPPHPCRRPPPSLKQPPHQHPLTAHPQDPMKFVLRCTLFRFHLRLSSRFLILLFRHSGPKGSCNRLDVFAVILWEICLDAGHDRLDIRVRKREILGLNVVS